MSSRSIDSQKLLVLTPQHPVGMADVKVVNPDGGTSVLTSGFEFYDSGNPVDIRRIDPALGPIAGGTLVTIDGEGFLPGATVDFGVTPATNVQYVSSGRLIATAPPRAKGFSTIWVENTDGSSASFYYYEYFDPSFRIGSATPSYGPGGSTVTISGSGFAAGATVTFGSSAATNVVVVSSTTITAAAPPGSALIADVSVTDPTRGTVTLPDGFIFEGAGSHIASVTPATGPVTGGTIVTITGTGLTLSQYERVWFGVDDYSDQLALGTISASDTRLVLMAPPSPAGPADIRIGGSWYNPKAVARKAFRYVEVPAIFSVAPVKGGKNGGTSVTLRGRGFATGAAVAFGGVAATNVIVVDPTTIALTTPAHAPGVVDLIVTNPDGLTGRATGRYEYLTCVTPPTAAVSGTATLCAGQSTSLSIALTGTAPWTLQWSDGFVQSGIATATATRSVSPSATTTYSIVSVADGECGGTATGSAVVTVKPTPSAQITGPVRFLPGSTGNVVSIPDAGAGATYSWTVQNGTITAGGGTRSITLSVGTISPATVSVTVQRDGCSASSSRAFLVTNQQPGDANGDSTVDVSDIFYLINHIFAGGSAPIGSGDANGDGTVAVADVFTLINQIFAGGS